MRYLLIRNWKQAQALSMNGQSTKLKTTIQILKQMIGTRNDYYYIIVLCEIVTEQPYQTIFALAYTQWLISFFDSRL